MNKKKNIIIVLAILCVLIFILILNNSNNNSDVKSNLIVSENINCDYNPKLYYEIDNRKIYSYCLDNIKVIVDNQNIELKEYLENNSIDDFIKMLEKEIVFYDGGTTLYKDGGTKKITSNNISLLKCNTLDGNKDIYIGNKDMEYKSNFCKDDNSTFTRTYMVKKIEKNKEQNCNDCLTCVCGNSLNVTLSQFQGETKTVIIDNYFDDLRDGNTYEFEFMLNEDVTDIEDDIDFIFRNSMIVDIRITDKLGLLQRQDEIK